MSPPIMRISDDVDTEGALVVSCFPGVGMVSSIIAHYLIENLDLKFVGGLRDARIPPICLVQDGAPLPPIRVYAGEPVCAMENCDKLILLTSELQIPDSIVFELTETLLEWSKSAGVGAGVLIDAFAQKGIVGVENMGQEPLIEYDDTPGIDVLGIGATVEVREKLKEMGIIPLEQGVMRGMTASLLAEARRRGLNIMAILVEADPRFPDARAAAELIGYLDTLLPTIELDLAPLLEEAEKLEAQLKGMLDRQLGPNIADKDSQTSPNSMLYG